jgi:hypothetical protein
MKYIKLFENWLNEAEVKPFDASNPGETLVVDITVGDMFKDDKTIASTMESVLNKAFAKKDSADVSKSLRVERFQFEFKDKGAFQTYLKEHPSALPLTNIDTKEKYFIQYFDLDSNDISSIEKLIENNQTLLLVSPEGSQYSKEMKRKNLDTRPVIGLTNDVFLLACDTDAKTWDGYPSTFGAETSIMDTKNLVKFNLLSGGSVNVNTCNFIGLFQIMSNPNVRKTAIEKLSFKTYPIADFDISQVAKTLGYKVPDNYTSKQGGIKQTSKA